MNGKFSAIRTLLNTTGLNYVNVQTGGLNYNNMTVTTSLQLVGTDSAGVMTTQAYALLSQGGMGFSYTAISTDAAKVLQVNSAGTGLTFDTTPAPAPLKMYIWNHFL